MSDEHRLHEKLVSVYENQAPFARIVADYLTENGVEASVDGRGGPYPHVSLDRVRVLVFETDADRARDLLRNTPTPDDEDRSTTDYAAFASRPLSPRRRRVGRVAAVIGILLALGAWAAIVAGFYSETGWPIIPVALGFVVLFWFFVYCLPKRGSGREE